MDQTLRQLTIGIAETLNTSRSIVNLHPDKLEKVSKLGVRVPHNLCERDKQDCKSIATRFLSRIKIKPFLNRIITGDEKWGICDNIVRKRQWLHKNQQCLSDSKANIHGENILLSKKIKILLYKKGVYKLPGRL